MLDHLERVAKGLIEEPRVKAGLVGIDSLSPREHQVYEALALGLSCREIGGMQDISKKTADTHRLNVLAKLGCRNVADVARIWIAERLASALGIEP